jgi:hypothetical protein
MPKELLDAFRLSLRAPQSRTDIAEHLLLGGWTLATLGVGLDVMVQEFVGIQVG